MQTYVERSISSFILKRVEKMPAVAILGPRQCGKSTLVKHIINHFAETLYLDLESDRDKRKLTDPEAFFEDNKDKTIVIDEIQRYPNLFPVLRSIIDKQSRNSQFIILGSASPDLIKQSSESLAGRISYIELTPFVIREIGAFAMFDLWLRGGYPRSFLEKDVQDSLDWRYDFIRTFLERDIPNLGFNFSVNNIKRLWQMCAHVSGGVLNYSNLAKALGVSSHTIKAYIDLLVQTYMVRLLPPFMNNLKKRLIKAPKIYVRDVGILHALLDIETRNDLMGHPIYGASWETFAVENILAPLPRWKPFFYRTASGNEIDLLLVKGDKVIAIECKASSSPFLEKGFFIALDDVLAEEAWVVAPVEDHYILDKQRNIHVGNPFHVVNRLLEID